MGFSVSLFWPFFRSVFRFLQQKSTVFRFLCLLRFSGFPSISIWFSVSGKNTSGFSDVLFAVVFGSSNLAYGFSEIMLVERKPVFMFKMQIRAVYFRMLMNKNAKAL